MTNDIDPLTTDIKSDTLATGSANTDPSFGNVTAIESKIPPFWPTNPEGWFAVAESFFDVGKISKKARYFHILSVLPQQVLEKVMDILTTASEDSYGDLKAAIISRLSLSEEERVNKLLFGCQMGDLKPSEFFRHLTGLAGKADMVNTKLVFRLWLSRLPKAIEVALIPLMDRDQKDIFDIADKIHAASTSSASIAPVSATTSKSTPQQALDSSVSSLHKRIDRLESMIQKLTASNHGRGRSLSRGRSNHPRSASTNSKSNNSFCWYHNKFGNKAKKCLSPCSFEQNNQPKN